MPKSLILYRHAKSDWGAEYGSDHDRPLNERGIDCAEIMGKVLALANQVPELVITSTAVRAKETLILSVESGEWKCDVEENEKIYQEDTGAVIDIIKSVPNKYDDIMLVGHEPKWSMLSSAFIGGVYGMVAGRLSHSWGTQIVAGLDTGLVWWVLGALIMMPLFLGMNDMIFVIGQTQWMSLMGHLIFGVITAALFVPLNKR